VKGVRYLLIPLILVMSHTVLAAEPVFGTDAESKYTREIRPPKGKAIVYIYQRQQDGTGVSPTIWLNNREIGRLVPGSFTVWQFSPGQVNVRVDGRPPASLSIATQAGRIYLFRLTVTQTAAGEAAQLKLMPESYRGGDLAATRLIKNPREVTASVARAPAAVPAPAPAGKPAATEQAAAKPAARPKAAPTTGGYALQFKTGALTLSEDRQTILGAERSFDDSASGLYGIEAYYQFPSGVTVGGEIIGYTAEFTTTGLDDRHDVDVLIILANARQYFRTSTNLQPFIGAGIGVASTDTSGPTIAGTTAGLAYQLLAGVEYRLENFGVFGEYKFISADTESDNNEKIDVSGSGLFAGISFHF